MKIGQNLIDARAEILFSSSMIGQYQENPGKTRECRNSEEVRASVRRRGLARALVASAAWTATAVVAWGQAAAGAGERVAEGLTRRALAKAGEKSEVTGLQRMAGNTVGLDFLAALDPEHQHRFLYRSGSAFGGVAVGDVDGDGRPDVFLAGAAGRSALFRNTSAGGGLSFEDVTKQSPGLDGGETWEVGAAFGDVDGDGDLDLYVCRYDSPNVLFLNDGSGRFAGAPEAWGAAISDASHSASFADYDRDGDLDLFVLTNRYEDTAGYRGGEGVTMEKGRPALKPGFEKYYEVWYEDEENWGVTTQGRENFLLRNDGGKFVDVTSAAGLSGRGEGLSTLWFDYDGDGWSDLYVANDLISLDQLWRNKGDGTFVNVMGDVVPHTAWFSMGSDFGDVNNDGAMDFFVADMSATNHFKQKTTMGVMGGKILERSQSTRPPQYMRNAFFINTGTGRFLEGAFQSGIASSDWTWAVQFTDLDSDGWQDLVVTNGTVRALNDSDRAITPAQLKLKHEWEYIKNYPPRREKNRVYRNVGGQKFKDQSEEWGLGEETVSYAAARGDLDGDGDSDFVVVNGDEQVSVYRNGLAGGQRLLVELRGTRSNRFGVGAKIEVTAGALTQTREMAATRGYLGSNELVEHFGLGAESKAARVRVTWPGGRVQEFKNVAAGYRYVVTEPEAAAGDVPAAKAPVKPPLFARAAMPWVGHRETYFDDFSRQPLLPNQLSQLGAGLAWGDVDGDGDDDLYSGGAAGQEGELRLNDGRGGFELHWVDAFVEDKAAEDMGSVFFDADGDGDLDLYVASGSYEFEVDAPALQDRLYMNDGQGGFTRAAAGVLPEARHSSGPVAAADFDRDGRVDIFVGGRVIPGRYPLSPRSQLLKNAGGTFADVADDVPGLAQAGMVTGALWSDANQDGWVDLLLTLEWGPVKLFLNEGGRLRDATAGAGLADRTGWWNSVAAGDVDADGDMDYVVTNVGKNTKYHASADHPVRLFYGDFEKDGNLQLVEAEYENGVLFPIRGKSCSTRAMPHLAGKFSTFNAFAKASLSEIYTPVKLDESHQFSVNTLESGILLNDGSGKFDFRPLPWMAQLAPCFGVAVTDVDADGKADVVLAQNFFGPQVETGRFAGGLGVVLRGDGAGGLSEVWPRESGLEVSGDAKALTLADFNTDGWPDLLVGRNNDEPVAFVRTRQPSAGRMLKVRLTAAAGALVAGARVTVQRADGTRAVGEVAAGSGYLSQSGPELYFGLGSAGSVREVAVRWPDGRETRHAGPWDGTKPVLLAHP